ncbi:PAS domain-containing protein [Corynebacterium caspium]|uniref:PAS domain-containing protein n=1 Tax=Corynebacterium caspium TaxID=234828 RepID=UPI00036DFCC2|nr:PAS domain-containing protein [Corynebacterium caspium]WKD59784.1 Aerotaxis receptor [Corynebacterium caspium DSM 44850]
MVQVLENINNPVEIEDVFFSTTDDQGRIELSNDVFIRLSKYTGEKLRGAPHNIIRHPDMPAGVFALMWHTLKEGRPFAGYVRNKAADGSPYDVLATVTPLPNGGYLSVRIRPVTDTVEKAFGLYDSLKEQEVADKRAKAQVAADSMERIPAALGLASYAQFMHRIMPIEVARREEMLRAAGKEATYEGSLAEIYYQLDSLMNKQEQVSKIIEELSETQAELAKESGVSKSIAAKMEGLGLDQVTSMLVFSPLRAWVNMHGIVDSYLQELQTLCADLVEVSHETRFTVALARLHAAQAMTFHANPASSGGSATEALAMLAAALQADIHALSDQLNLFQRCTKRLSSRSASVVRIMEPVHELLAEWAKDADATIVTQELIDEVAEAISSADTAMQNMTLLSQTLLDAPAYDAEELDHMSALVREVR